ncbi:MAG: hypothetical protein II978_02190 [Clostridia bacterium]|nr:hypothetical protein [Clostridia bacterium]
MKIKNLVCLLLAILLCGLAGCGQADNTVRYRLDKAASSINSETVAQNERYAMEWDDENKNIILREKSTGKSWADIPLEYLSNGGSSESVNSTINITVYEVTTSNITEVRGYSGAVENGRLFCKKIKNGIRLTYCFDDYEIAIPVTYTLKDDCVKVTINGKGILETGEKYKLISVSLAPFLCSAKNDDPSAYLFIPSGSGALMYVNENGRKTRKYAGELYGEDASRIIQESDKNETAVRLPVFGAKSGDTAILGIVGEESGTTLIEAEAGNTRTHYSSVYPKFYFRGFDNVTHPNNGSYIERISEDISKRNCSVEYYPLIGNEADYNGMARCYRNYLTKNDKLRQSDVEQQPYSVTFLGGIEVSKLFMGISYTKLFSMTNYSQALEIIKELDEQTANSSAVRMMGYGDGGISGGSLAGGFVTNSDFGNRKQFNELKEYTSNNSRLFWDYDLIWMKKSGNGFSYSNDVSKTAILMKAERNQINVPLRDFNTKNAFRVLKRSLISDAMDKLLKKAKKQGIDGISLSSLGSVSYSDYGDTKYYEKAQMSSDVRSIIDKAVKNGSKVAVSNANSYAASVADIIFDAPSDNGGYFVLDANIPFYQLVFSGSKPMYSSAVNLSGNIKQSILHAAIGGMGLSYTLINDYDVNFSSDVTQKLYGAVYSGNKTAIVSAVKKYNEFFEKIENSKLLKYEILGNNVSKSEFSNGVILYANNSDKTAESPAGILQGYEYAVVTQ